MNSLITIIHAYSLLLFACTAGFAAYDLRTRQVPDRALLLFCPVALAAPFLNALNTCMCVYATTICNAMDALSMTLTSAPEEISLPQFLAALPPALLSSLAGMATGFLILLTAALASKNGAGVGGGDIKLAAAMGFAYGPSHMVTILLIASGLAVIASIVTVLKHKDSELQKPLSLPFVPFLAAGSLAVTLTTII